MRRYENARKRERETKKKGEVKNKKMRLQRGWTGLKWPDISVEGLRMTVGDTVTSGHRALSYSLNASVDLDSRILRNAGTLPIHQTVPSYTSAHPTHNFRHLNLKPQASVSELHTR